MRGYFVFEHVGLANLLTYMTLWVDIGFSHLAKQCCTHAHVNAIATNAYDHHTSMQSYSRTGTHESVLILSGSIYLSGGCEHVSRYQAVDRELSSRYTRAVLSDLSCSGTTDLYCLQLLSD